MKENENQMVVRCNWCMHIFPEDNILLEDTIDPPTEFCPECEQDGCLMDMGVYGEEDDKVLFPYLSRTKDWELLKRHFRLDILCDFENEIRDYEEGVGNEDREDYPTIVQWWEGLMDTREVIETYDTI